MYLHVRHFSLYNNNAHSGFCEVYHAKASDLDCSAISQANEPMTPDCGWCLKHGHMARQDTTSYQDQCPLAASNLKSCQMLLYRSLQGQRCISRQDTNTASLAKLLGASGLFSLHMDCHFYAIAYSFQKVHQTLLQALICLDLSI